MAASGLIGGPGEEAEPRHLDEFAGAVLYEPLAFPMSVSGWAVPLRR
jgi:hypothetical protein